MVARFGGWRRVFAGVAFVVLILAAVSGAIELSILFLPGYIERPWFQWLLLLLVFFPLYVLATIIEERWFGPLPPPEWYRRK